MLGGIGHGLLRDAIEGGFDLRREAFVRNPDECSRAVTFTRFDQSWT